jgi:CTD kinase subunit beta
VQDVTLAALYVSSKMHDTLKKPREILMASYSVRFPEQAAKSKSIVGEIDMDPMVRERGREPLSSNEATAKGYGLVVRFSSKIDKGYWLSSG